MPRARPRPSNALLRALGERGEWLAEQAATSVSSRRQTIRDLEDAGRQEASTQRDYAGRYPIELLQNAHDAQAAASVKGTVVYIVERNALVVANQGKPFDARRIRSLVRQGSSEKAERSRKRTIGYKGVGFSSVFELSETPQIFTAAGLAFGFDREKARGLVEQHLKRRPKIVAARNFPFLLDDDAWNVHDGLIDSLMDDGFATVIRLPFRRGQTAATVATLLDGQLGPHALVFLPWARKLEIRRGAQVTAWETSPGVRVGAGRVVHIDDSTGDRQSWLAHHGTALVTRDEIEALEDPAWTGISELRATVALPWANRTITPTDIPPPIHLYFPTAETTGRGCLIHGDFYVDSGRAHIFDHGAAGTLNDRLAQRIGELTIELAESVASRHAPGLFAALAFRGTASTFGDVINKHMTRCLTGARVVRPADGGTPDVAGRLRFISSASAETDALLVQLMSKRDDLVRVDDYAAPGVIDLLSAIGVGVLSTQETARRVTLARSKVAYEKALAFLCDWIEEADNDRALLTALGERKIVKDIDGAWCAPKAAVLSLTAVPPLPEALRKRELAPVRGERARALLEHLGVDELTPGRALAIIQTALTDGSFGSTDEEKQQLHDWLDALHTATPAAFRNGPPLGGGAPVPARPAGGGQLAWVAANSAYFGAGWTDIGPAMEILYGSADRQNFLDDTRDHGPTRTAFYAALGVARLPRQRAAYSPHARQRSAWLSQAEVRARAACPNGHTGSEQAIRCDVPDRFDEIVDRACADQEAAEALTRVLAAMDPPFGQDATFTCTHSQHRGAAAARRVPGYQRWRLTQADWLPVVGDPQDRPRRSPSVVWSGVPRSQRDLLLPRPRVPLPAKDFELVPWDQPTPDQVETALGELADSHPALTDAPPAALKTASALLRKLETSLRPDERRAAIALPGEIDGHPAWVTDGVVMDVPGLDHVPGLASVPVSTTSKIRAAYGLPSAHDRLRQTVHARASRDRPLMLTRERRTQLVVLLNRHGAAARLIAKRLNGLQEVQADDIELVISLEDDRTHTLPDLPFKLLVETTGSTLFINDPENAHRVAVATALADYLDAAQHAQYLALALLAPDELLHDVSDDELAEAWELLDEPTAASDDESESIVDDQAERDEQADADVDAPPVPTDVEVEASGSTALRAPAPRPIATDRARAIPTVEDGAGRQPEPPGRAHDTTRERRPATTPEPTAPRPVSDSASPSNADSQRTALPDPATAAFGTPRPTTADGASPLPHGSPRTDSRPPDRPPHAGDPMSPSTDHTTSRGRRDEHSEHDAVRYVSEYATRELGVVEIRDRQPDKCGWDLEFVYADGRLDLVEVKGSTSSRPFEITRNELEKSRTHDNYVLYFLAGQGTDSPVLYRFDDFGTRVDDATHLRAASWAVVGWQELDPQAIAVTLPSG